MFQIALSIIVGALAHSADWPSEFDARLEAAQCQTLSPHNKSISVPYDEVQSAEQFELFYFLDKPFDANLPTLLFIDGGPGQGPGMLYNTLRFTNLPEINVVYFHQRGVGCSSFPASNKYDIYLGTDYVAKDIEFIRKDLGIKKWDLIWGTSYGTGVATRYAALTNDQHSDKIVLEAWHLPDYEAENLELLIVTKGLPNLVEILGTWEEYVSNEEILAVSLHIMQNVEALFAGEIGLEFTTVNGRQFSSEELSTLFSQLRRLGYVGAAHDSDFAKLGAYGPLNTILSLFNEGAPLGVPQMDIAPANDFPMTSNRVFFVTTLMEGLEAQFRHIVKELGVSAFSLSQALKFLGPYWNTEMVPAVDVRQTEDLSLSSSRYYIIQGNRDLATPVDAVKSYLSRWAELPSHVQFFELPSYGHSRHFSDDCYQKILSELVKNQPDLSLDNLNRDKCLAAL